MGAGFLVGLNLTLECCILVVSTIPKKCQLISVKELHSFLPVQDSYSGWTQMPLTLPVTVWASVNPSGAWNLLPNPCLGQTTQWAFTSALVLLRFPYGESYLANCFQVFSRTTSRQHSLRWDIYHVQLEELLGEAGTPISIKDRPSNIYHPGIPKRNEEGILFEGRGQKDHVSS